ncbi:MAG: tRNA (N(6)-L-threonylcarbamoyladenosine(37)-C(2))-methylthiotransferase MtaB [Candidatus Omnitrophota bacterium]
MKTMKATKFAIKTLGCKVNQYEEQVIRENLLRFGFRESGSQAADIVVINSCTVTDQADVKIRKLIRKVKKENPRAKIFVTGCYAVFEEDVKLLRSLPEVYMVVPAGEKNKLPLILDSLFGGGAEEKNMKEQVSGFSCHTRAFLKIQDGCNQNCSYCKVNLVRGPSRCRDERDVLDEVIRLAAEGYREIVLTGICLGNWKAREEGPGLAHLLKEIEGIEGDFRIRISSIEPNHIDEELIETIAASGRVCRHLHIPLQSGSDRVLKAMNRRYTTEEFRKLTGRLRQSMPFVGISMDCIAGFPGETEADFDRTLEFLREVKPSRLHVFKYSDREGTPAFRMGSKVHVSVARERVQRLIELGSKLQAEFSVKFIGTEVDILVERRSKDALLEGYTGEYVRAKLYGFDGSEGDIIRVKCGFCDETSPCLVAKSAKIPSKSLI